MDIADKAQQHIEREHALALAAARSRKTGPEATGECLWCGEPLDDDRRWCDAGCRDDWERATALHR